MKLWVVTRTDTVDYEEYDGWVARAATEDDAVRIIWEEYSESDGRAWTLGSPGSLNVFRSRVAVTPLVAFGDDEIVLSSFNAG